MNNADNLFFNLPYMSRAQRCGFSGDMEDLLCDEKRWIMEISSRI